MPAEDLTIKATWDVNKYTIKFVVDGVETLVEYEFGATITAPEAPEKIGHTFKGWDVEIPETMPAEDLTIKATWDVNKYTITFVVDGVETPVEYDFGATIAAPEAPEKEGFVFKGWSPELPETMPAENLTLTAIFKEAYIKGDTNDDGSVNNADAIYLLYNVIFGETAYPIGQNCDFNGDGAVNNADAIYLLYNVIFGDTAYPLN